MICRIYEGLLRKPSKAMMYGKNILRYCILGWTGPESYELLETSLPDIASRTAIRPPEASLADLSCHAFITHTPS
jgi:hypothetical protein